jgi:hypothetical protein
MKRLNSSPDPNDRPLKKRKEEELCKVCYKIGHSAYSCPWRCHSRYHSEFFMMFKPPHHVDDCVDSHISKPCHLCLHWHRGSECEYLCKNNDCNYLDKNLRRYHKVSDCVSKESVEEAENKVNREDVL